MNLISVLMPAYNAEAYVDEAVRSILSQTYENFELIVLDDGSEDNTMELVAQVAEKDSRVRLLKQKNSGVVAARNRLLEHAKGNIIAWMDADDISYPERLEVMSNYLERHKEIVALGCGIMLIDEDGDEICNWRIPDNHLEIDALHLHGQGGAIGFPASMMIKEAVLQVGGFQAGLTGAEDLDLFLKLAEVGLLHNLSNKLYKYRQCPQSISHVKRVEIVANTEYVVSCAYTRRGLLQKDIISRETNVSICQLHKKWAWWALSAGNKQTARKHAWRAFWHQPFSLSSWKVLICSMRGY